MSAEHEVIRRAMTVRGRVQGVSFRYYTEQQATMLGLVGWVRNQRDGTVRIEAQGPARDVEALVAWVHHGPRHARVTAVEVTEIDPTDVDIAFDVVP